MDEVITLQFDGGSRGNPGPAAVGVVLRAEDGTPIVTIGKFIGRATNNVAEYKALITALEEAKKLGARKIIVKGDSELIIKQMRGEYRVKSPDLRELYDEAQHLLQQFDKAKIEHNYREDNTLADKLANLAMDRKGLVTDVDDPGPKPSSRSAPSPFSDVPKGRVSSGAGAPAKIAPAKPAATLARPSNEHVPNANAIYTCPRCSCSIQVLAPSSSPDDELGPFGCVCGVRMKRV